MKFSLFGKHSKDTEKFITAEPDPDGAEALTSPLSGNVYPIESVSDPVFSGKVLGDGLAIEPFDGKVYSPVNGTVETMMDTMHAVGIKSDGGAEILIHIGKDTVSLKGRFFESHVKENDRIKKGQLIIEFDIDAIKKAGFDLITPVIITNHNDFDIKKQKSKEINAGDILMTLYSK
jgi:glucose-specific phosphotransferase system IIA component